MNELLTLAPSLVLAMSALLVWRHWALAVTAVATAMAFLASVIVVATGVPSPLVSVLLLYTTGVVAVLGAFSRRHLDGDVRASRYSRAFLLTAALALVVVASSNLLVIAVAWVLTGRALAELLGHHDRVIATADAVRRFRQARLASDAALVIAVMALVGSSGESSVAAVTAWAAANPTALALPIATVALFIAAAARSGLWPFSRWLVQSVVSPAPVSALLHAGIVNAPVVLLITLQPVWTVTTGANVMLALVGFGSAIILFPRKLVRPDVKTRLAWSTCAQLGFMLGLVAIGAPLAAIAHMVLHGVYKASAFLGAGDQIGNARASKAQPMDASPASTRAIGMVAGLLIGGGFVTVVGGWGQPVTSVTVVVAFGAAGCGLLALGARGLTRVVSAVLAVTVVGLMAAGVHALGGYLSLSNTSVGVLPWAAAAMLLAASVGFAYLTYRQPARVWIRLQRWAHPHSVVPLGRRHAPDAGSTSAVGAHVDDRAMVRDQLQLAAESIPPTWSWQGFIASNPLLGFVDRPFDQAVASVAAGRGWATLPGLPAGSAEPLGPVDNIVAGWLSSWTDTGDAPWPAPGRSDSFWQWFRTVAVHDRVFTAAARTWLDALPADALDVVVSGVKQAGEPVNACEVWLRQQLLRLPGWSGFVGRRDTVEAALSVEALIDLMAVRVATSRALGVDARPAEVRGPSAVDLGPTLAALSAAESAYRVPVLAELAVRAREHDEVSQRRSDADLVFCIDPRSEPMRRHLETQGGYRTVGFAGFFGFAVQSNGTSSSTMHHPVLLSPTVTVDGSYPRAATVRELLNSALGTALNSVGGGFAAVEVGALRGLWAAARTVVPGWFAASQPRLTDAGLEPVHDVDAAAALVQITGLHGPTTAPVVVLTAHGSTSTNNPTESAFDCGACGGQRGGLNAWLAASTLNDPVVRAQLAQQGLLIPDDTTFVAAEHDTATDEVTFLGDHERTLQRKEPLRQLTQDLQRAGFLTTAERATSLPLVRGTQERVVSAARRLSGDWATVRHEYGLVNNSLFIAAPRHLTRDLDLSGRAFLHDYDAQTDGDGVQLRTILTAPLVVAQWINSQYFFSATDPQNLGSGSKTAHNPVGGVGVLAGASGDLLAGLSEQSVRYNGELVHEPLRLLAVVAAEPSAIAQVLAEHQVVNDLVRNEWLTLCAIDLETGAIQRVTGSKEVQADRTVSVLDISQSGMLAG